MRLRYSVWAGKTTLLLIYKKERVCRWQIFTFEKNLFAELIVFHLDMDSKP